MSPCVCRVYYVLPGGRVQISRYHDKIHVSFVVQTATTLVEATLARVLVDLVQDDAPDKDLNDRINMTVARTELTEDDKQILRALRRARNLIAHDISHHTDYRATEKVEELDNHFDPTSGAQSDR